MTQPVDDLDDDPVLPTFAVLARFASAAASPEEAVHDAVRRLTSAEEPFHEVTTEQREGGGSWVVARFVLVSVDAHTAVTGLHETLSAAGLAPDEVWADQQL